MEGASAIIDEVTALRRLEGHLVCGSTFEMSPLWAIAPCNSKIKTASATMDEVTAVTQMEGTWSVAVLARRAACGYSDHASSKHVVQLPQCMR